MATLKVIKTSSSKLPPAPLNLILGLMSLMAYGNRRHHSHWHPLQRSRASSLQPKKQFSINSLRAERLNESFEEEAI